MYHGVGEHLAMQSLDLKELRRQLTDPWALEDQVPAALPAIAQDLQALAHRAYEEGDDGARRLTEEILYYINIDNCFAPPLHTTPVLAWTTLMRVKLASLRRRFGGCEPIDVAEMARRLKSA